MLAPGETIGQADLLIIPGTKNSILDMLYLQQRLKKVEGNSCLAAEGAYVAGICGGFLRCWGRAFGP